MKGRCSPAGPVRLILETGYPEAEAISMRLEAPQPARFALRLRVPAWSRDVSLRINGSPVSADAEPGDWASVEREWRDGDRIDMTVPLRFRRVPIDRQHPNRVAVVRGPVVYAQQVVHKHMTRIPEDDEALDAWMVRTDDPAVFRYEGQEQSSQRDDFMPLYRFGEMATYRLYFDPELRHVLW